MSPIKKVALAGVSTTLLPRIETSLTHIQAGGLIGTPVLNALVQSDFDVTVLTRQDSTSTFPPSVQVVRVDYTSKSALVSALRGHDAVVSALTHLALETAESLLIDAAVEAGVKRFIPSEFGGDTTNPRTATFALYAAKVASHKHLEQVAAANPGFTYTSVLTGPLLGWVASQAFLQPKEKKAQLYDGGERPFSVVTRETMAKAVVGVLSHPEETRNRAVRVHDAAVTLKELLAAAQNAVGEDGWTVTTPGVDETLANAWAGVKAGNFDFSIIFGFIVAASQGEGYGALFEETDNELFGIPVKTAEEVRSIVERVAVNGDPSGW
jgi:uncharacterized protein YbjT (DUF2867 family)